ncbi:MAG: 30S ribosome-binding factor RbfA [Bacillota bacterium]|nr:30S ribosome-binding factor RbfA [Bacillota bacterium]
MAERNGRIKHLIGKNIADIVQLEIKNPKIGMVSVNEVEVYNDYSKAIVYVTFLGQKYPHQRLLELKKSEGFVRSKLAKRLDLYKAPQIEFVYDESFDRMDSLEKALQKEGDDLENAKKGDSDE